MLRHMVMALTIATAAPAMAADLKAEVAADWRAHLGPLFDHFHRNPELGFQEVKTAARIAAELRAVGGIEVTERVGGTGVVGVMRNGPGRTVLIRADMDGLPVEERSGLANASKARQVDRAGVDQAVMHACGHDTHITGLVGAARRLAAHRARWSGTVVFVAQPAEELLGGAKSMIEAGLYTRFPKPDYALAYHVASGIPTGRISFSDTLQYASSDAIDITVHGVGAHGASPHRGRDPVLIGSAIVVALQSIVTREIDPLRPAIITVGTFNAGTARNIISEKAELKLTMRANDEETRAALPLAVKRLAEGVARAHGVAEDRLPTVDIRPGTPTTINTPALAQRLRPVLATALGADAIQPFEQKGMGAEDFAFFVAPEHGVQGLYFAVGGTPQAAIDAERAGGPPVPSHHSPLFRVDGEAAVKLGTEAMVVAAMELLSKPGVAANALAPALAAR